ncbi:hypothetical protein AN958_06030 [Leucoagaricus sp. SymC.cos]|nr:hypothetical protein AN958_06030 [Leucoagaricus sp. SymC.cos]
MTVDQRLDLTISLKTDMTGLLSNVQISSRHWRQVDLAVSERGAFLCRMPGSQCVNFAMCMEV